MSDIRTTTKSDEQRWMDGHKGAFIKAVGYVWWCGDDECNCTQAVIVDYFENKVVPGCVPVRRWEGNFHTDGEPGAETELAAERDRLRAADPAAEAAIEWA
jgi:hypothetical protein